eukprot:1807266-Lingulodinium_polyedra.AAC.1
MPSRRAAALLAAGDGTINSFKAEDRPANNLFNNVCSHICPINHRFAGHRRVRHRASRRVQSRRRALLSVAAKMSALLRSTPTVVQ